jgi:hypothetical protein
MNMASVLLTWRFRMLSVKASCIPVAHRHTQTALVTTRPGADVRPVVLGVMERGPKLSAR